MNIGIIGVGHLGRIHLKCLIEEGYGERLRFYDQDRERCQSIAGEFGMTALQSMDEFTEWSDVAFLVSPTSTHFAIADRLIRAGIHVFIEKPVTADSQEAQKLLEIARQKDVKVQIGHIERFNPAFTAFEEAGLAPKFIECHRLSTYNERGTDVSVVMDLMIHDLDLLLHIVGADVVEIRAIGVPLLSATADICNARLVFENGAVANVTASRVSMKQMRKMRMFQPDSYATIDFISKELQVFKMKESLSEDDDFRIETQLGPKTITVQVPDIPNTNAIKEEQKSFFKSIKEDTDPLVSLADGMKAVALAEAITERMKIESKVWN